MGAEKRRGHVLAVPFPAQGHVTPLLKLSRLIASHGVRVTFVNTHFIHAKIARAANGANDCTDGVVMTSISDGLAGNDDRNDAFRLWGSLKSTMVGHLTELIEKINGSNRDEMISCVIVDVTLGWVLEVATKFGAKSVCFTPASAASMAMTLQIPNLIQQGNLDLNGTLKGKEVVSLSNDIPPWKKDEFAWSFPADLETQKIMLQCCLSGEKTVKSLSNWIICNSCYELESSACDLNPKFLPIGPLLNTNISKSKAKSSSFYVEDTSCLSWLDEKEPSSVIYVSFGSIAIFSNHQIEELALGLKLSDRPFLWVMRSGLAREAQRIEYPDQFFELGKIVLRRRFCLILVSGAFYRIVGGTLSWRGWARACPSCVGRILRISTIIRNICDKWEIGLRIEQDGNGIRVRDEIKKKIGMLFLDNEIRANALRLKHMAQKSVATYGSSFMNFKRFIDNLVQ